MKIAFLVLPLTLALTFEANAKAVEPGQPIILDVERVRISELAMTVYGYTLSLPYVLTPDVMADDRLVSARISATSPNEFRDRFLQYMHSVGYTVSRREGADQVAKTPEPPPPPPPPPAKIETFVYHPLFRDPSYISGQLKPLFQTGGFTVSRQISAPAGAESSGPAPSGSAAALIDRNGSDVLVFAGTAQDVQRLKEILPKVDTRPGEVYVEAAVYEVNTGSGNGSAFSLALDILGSHIGYSQPKTDLGAGASSLSLGTTWGHAVFSILNQDTRFHVVDRPSGRVMSGKSTRLSAGQQVPVLGAVSYQTQSGVAVQSVEYRDSGVILDVTPQIRDKSIELHVSQEISNFAQTTTGVNNTPTLTKRAMDTTLIARDGETVILGGLVEEKDTSTDSGPSFLPDWLRSKTQSKTKIELLLILNVRLVETPNM